MKLSAICGTTMEKLLLNIFFKKIKKQEHSIEIEDEANLSDIIKKNTQLFLYPVILQISN